MSEKVSRPVTWEMPSIAAAALIEPARTTASTRRVCDAVRPKAAQARSSGAARDSVVSTMTLPAAMSATSSGGTCHCAAATPLGA
jgi:hypothetical protein